MGRYQSAPAWRLRNPLATALPTVPVDARAQVRPSAPAPDFPPRHAESQAPILGFAVKARIHKGEPREPADSAPQILPLVISTSGDSAARALLPDELSISTPAAS